MSQARLPRTEPSTELITAHKANHRAAHVAGRAVGIFAKVRCTVSIVGARFALRHCKNEAFFLYPHTSHLSHHSNGPLCRQDKV